MINQLDATLSLATHAWIGAWPLFDRAVAMLAGFHLFKGGVMMVVFWALWFAQGYAPDRRRGRLAAVLVGAIAAMIVARTLSHALPIRLRPRFDPELKLAYPSYLDMTDLSDWSSFPSDHAALFVALAVGFCFVSRRIGLMTLVYAVVAICLPRLYLGLHYATDLVVGAAIGAACAWICQHAAVRRHGMEIVQSMHHRSPAALYAVLFLFTQQLVENFDSARSLANAAVSLGGRLVAGLSPLAGG